MKALSRSKLTFENYNTIMDEKSTTLLNIENEPIILNVQLGYSDNNFPYITLNICYQDFDEDYLHDFVIQETKEIFNQLYDLLEEEIDYPIENNPEEFITNNSSNENHRIQSNICDVTFVSRS